MYLGFQLILHVSFSSCVLFAQVRLTLVFLSCWLDSIGTDSESHQRLTQDFSGGGQHWDSLSFD